eukprot:gene8282-10176_t
MDSNNKLDNYKFPINKIGKLKDSNKKPLVLLASGSFNPITYMHLRMMEIGRDLCNEQGEFEVIGGYLSPVSDLYKKSTLIPSKFRSEMAEIATKSSDWIMIDHWEVQRPVYSTTRTILDHIRDTINDLHKNGEIDINNKLNHKIHVKLVCGADLLGSFNIPNLWADNDMHLITSNSNYGMVCLERTGTDTNEIIKINPILQKNRNDIIFAPMEIINDISSTKLRESVSKGRSIRYLTSVHVINYIKEHQLYLSTPPK